MSTDPKIGVVLGGGAARGLSHIAYMEAMDEMGLTPSLISGSSIGSLLGAGWAAGLSGQEIRSYAHEYLGSMRTIVGRLLSQHFSDVGALFRNGLTIQMDALDVVEGFVPDSLPQTFDELKIPLKIAATDIRTWHQAIFHHGALREAIAASIAIPTIMRPMQYAGRTLIDGSVVNALPLDLVAPEVDIIVAIDVSGEPRDFADEKLPTGMDLGWRSAQIMMHSMVTASLAAHPPDVFVRPDTKAFGAMEFWRVREILDANQTHVDGFKRELNDAVEAFIAAPQKTR